MSDRIAGELELLVARRRRTLPVRLGAGLVVLFCLIGTGSLRADPAAAARPVKGALYVQNSDTSAAYLRVSRSGRWLNPRGSAINLDRSVSKCRYHRSPDITYRLGRRRRPVRISQSGRFRFVQRIRSFVWRVRGRFITPNEARIEYRYGWTIARLRKCNSGPIRVTAHRGSSFRFRDCRTHRARTVLWAPTGRVFQHYVFRRARFPDPLTGRPAGPLRWMGVIYACLFSTNSYIEVVPDYGDDSAPGEFWLVEPYVAFTMARCDEMPCLRSVVVRDLRDGKMRETWRVDGELFAGITDLKLKENGSIAWIAYYPQFQDTLAVLADDGLGTRVLDSGADIAPQSLELNDSTLTWENGGVARSAPLE